MFILMSVPYLLLFHDVVHKIKSPRSCIWPLSLMSPFIFSLIMTVCKNKCRHWIQAKNLQNFLMTQNIFNIDTCISRPTSYTSELYYYIICRPKVNCGKKNLCYTSKLLAAQPKKILIEFTFSLQFTCVI